MSSSSLSSSSKLPPPPSISSSSLQQLEELPDDVTGRILLFCDFESAMTFSRSTCKVLRTRYEQQEADLRHVWREIYHRHGFGPLEQGVEEESRAAAGVIVKSKKTRQQNQQQQQNENQKTMKNDDCHYNYYIEETLFRRKLLRNLLQDKKMTKKKKVKKNTTQCLNLPHRYFHFLPIVPKQLLFDDDEDEDPPPIFYECDSFVLTSTGTGSELVLLNPFDGSLSVLGDIQEYCATAADDSEASMMALALDGHNKKDNSYWIEDTTTEGAATATMAITTNESEYHAMEEDMMEHSELPAHTPKEQCLLDSDDYFQFDIAPYFPNRRNIQLSEEYELTFMGTDAKPILNGKALMGSMVGIGRSVRNLQDIDIVCTELTTWTRFHGEEKYDHRMVCRFPWTFHLVDMDAMNQRFFVSFHKGDGPLGHQERPSNTPSTRMAVYPMVSASSKTSYFPQPLFTIECGEPISSFVLNPAGDTLLVATKRGNLQLWDVRSNDQQKVKRIQRIRLRDALRESIRTYVTRNTKSSLAKTDARQTSKHILQQPAVDAAASSHTITSHVVTQQAIDDGHIAAASDDTQHQNGTGAFAVLSRQLEAPRFRKPVDCLFISKHDSLTSGFVTLQRDQDDGTSLLLWRQGKVVSVVNVPLSSKRSPRVYYENNRLIVFGEDHIGMIILVYNVACDDLVGSDLDDEQPLGEASGGVYNLTSRPVIRFANRIRHVALGGIDSFDSIHMTCNERFLVVNTRTGNLLDGCPLPEGLLVIDLLDTKYSSNKCE